MKKLIALCAAIAVAVCMMGASGAADSTKTPLDILVNLYTPGEDHMYSANIEMEGLPISVNGTAMVSLRALAAYLHLDLFFGNGLFDEDGHPSLLLSDGHKTMEFGVFENNKVYLEDADKREESKLPVSTLMVEGRMYVPVKFVAEYFGFIVTENVQGVQLFSPYRHGTGNGLVISNFSILSYEDLNVIRDNGTFNWLSDYPLDFTVGDKTYRGISLGDSMEKVRNTYGKEMYEKVETNSETELCYGTLSTFSDVSQIRLYFTFDKAGKLVSLEAAIY